MPNRKPLLARMLHSILENPGVNETFEVIVHAGDQSLGAKVTRMIGLAQGTHVVVWDDDDWVSSRAIESLTPQDEDFVGFDIAVIVDDMFSATYRHDARLKSRSMDGTGHEMGVGQKCPIRRELAAEYPYPDEYFGDLIWSAKVAELVETHTVVPKTLYYYDYRNGDRFRNVGPWPHDKSQIRWL